MGIYRHEAYENFSLLYTYLVEVMEAICENDTSHGEKDWITRLLWLLMACPKCTILSPL